MRDRGVKHLAVYAFSTENWNRAAEEVSYLMKLFRDIVETHFIELAKENIRIRFVGERKRFDADMRASMERIEKESEKNTALTLWVCLSYGGRTEIAAAARAAGNITEESIGAQLWTAGMPPHQSACPKCGRKADERNRTLCDWCGGMSDPDIIIRTGGEKRLSGFLTWQSIYSELFFIDQYWPDFSESILDSILTEYEQRERRMGA